MCIRDSVKATYEVLVGQLEMYKDQLKNDVQSLHEFTKDGDFVDFGRRMILKDGIEYFNFGKYNGQSCTEVYKSCLLYTSPSPRDRTRSRMPSSA